MALNKNAKAWVKALRSRKYKQTTGCLTNDGKFCCLGVACELAVKAKVIPAVENDSYDGNSSTLPASVQHWLGLQEASGLFKKNKDGTTTDLTILNDSEKKTFGQIARVIESEPEGLFEETK